MWHKEFENALTELKRQAQWRELSLPEGSSFSHNDYLGLSDHPAIREKAIQCLRQSPSGSRGSRLLGGHREEHALLEEKIARFFKSPEALFFSTGYLANLGLVQALAGFAGLICSDEQNHASLVDAIRLTKKPRLVFPHGRWPTEADLPEGNLLYVAESLYSMSGSFLDLSVARSRIQTGRSFLVLDEAHAAGVFDDTGRGLSAGWRDWKSMAVLVTFGKAFGVAGGAVLCSKEIKELLINSARTFIYTTAPPPAVIALVSASIDVMEEDGPGRRKELWRRSEWAACTLRDAGLPVSSGQSGGPWSPIIALLVPGNDRALRLSQTMRNLGWDLRAIRYPTVAKGSERLRISVNLQVSWEETQKMIRELVEQWKAFS
jgi:8-amino-7-oxononanoate synthase